MRWFVAARQTQFLVSPSLVLVADDLWLEINGKVESCEGWRTTLMLQICLQLGNIQFFVFKA